MVTIKSKYARIVLALKSFRSRIVVLVMRRNFNVLSKDVLVSKTARPFPHKQNIVDNASKSNLSFVERVKLFFADLTVPKKVQRETRIYRDKKTKKVTVVDGVRRIK